MTSRRQQKSERKKLDILRSAAWVFRKKGYHNATMEDISERLLMTKGSLYYYFKSKEEIFYQCQQYVLDKLLEGLKAGEALPEGPAERLRHLVRNHIGVITDELSGSVLHLDFDLLSPPRLQPIIRKRDQYEQGIRRLIQDGVRQDVFRRCDVKLTTFALLGALNWVSKWYSAEGGRPSDEIATAFADYLVGGLTATVVATPAPDASRTARPSGAPALPNGNEPNFAEESWLL